MLISSRTIKGRCPICGVANCACGGPTDVIAVDERVGVAGKGPLLPFAIRPGLSMMLTEEGARARGLLSKKQEPPPNKKREPVPNKKRPPAPNKGR